MSSLDNSCAPASPPPAPRAVRSWQEAEHNAAAWMRYWGYADAVAAPGGSDGGIDIRAGDALAQVKYKAAQVGRPELQLLFGARGHVTTKQLIFFTGSDYAATAVAYAADHDIALFLYELDGSMKPVNELARRISTITAPVRSKSVPADSVLSESGVTVARSALGRSRSIRSGAANAGSSEPLPPGLGRILLGVGLFILLFCIGSTVSDPVKGALAGVALVLLVWGASTKRSPRLPDRSRDDGGLPRLFRPADGSDGQPQ
ncbi:restriction endonuclease [Micromonospora sp. NPDC005299]|uniref:restriction endonuclease n=1 Tax=Micromonospora sp. NPDC005299 TaxID=3364231 RepID=UPI00368ED596